MLLTGFEPFAGNRVNPSWEAVRMVGESWDGDAHLTVRRLPVEFGDAATRLLASIATHTPDVVIATGVAEGRTGITPERVAINLADAAIADNAGVRPIDEPVVAGGPAAYFSTLPVAEMVTRIRAAGLPAHRSLSAGAYVCNHVFYRLQHALRDVDVTSGFIHVPATPEMSLGPEVPTMTVDAIAEALSLAVTVAAHSGE